MRAEIGGCYSKHSRPTEEKGSMLAERLLLAVSAHGVASTGPCRLSPRETGADGTVTSCWNGSSMSPAMTMSPFWPGGLLLLCMPVPCRYQGQPRFRVLSCGPGGCVKCIFSACLSAVGISGCRPLRGKKCLDCGVSKTVTSPRGAGSLQVCGQGCREPPRFVQAEGSCTVLYCSFHPQLQSWIPLCDQGHPS